MENHKKVSNRLIYEKSPYLLQHAHNPVRWYPWGEEAFDAARKQDKPVFLSIGYSTCHWCHVMERESFEDEEIAALLNRSFIAIKVDREERPDVDHIYMSVCQALTGSGGWPLSIFMTPAKEPFFAGTYFPKHSRGGMRGFAELLALIASKWRTDHLDIAQSAHKITAVVENAEAHKGGDQAPDDDVVRRAAALFAQAFDDKRGGFGQAPKFPTPHSLLFLLRVFASEGSINALAMVDKTLDAMRRGGIYDHIGGGFCRYSTDARWLAPHFEKMLYDNALLMMAYTEAYQATQKNLYASTVREVADYILREMQADSGRVGWEGGFCSAEDADSEGEEGKFYLWSMGEVIHALGEEDGKRFCELYDITKKGNFEGKNIPNLIAGDLSDEDVAFARACRVRLFARREARVHPHKDDKILTAWNGLMIAALAKAGVAFKEDRFLKAANAAADFILQNLVREDGRLLARYRDGEAKYPAYAEDYAFLVWGLVELYEAEFDVVRLTQALQLTDALIDLFWDEDEGGLYVYGRDAEELLFRPKSVYDGAMPSANAVFAQNCLVLSGLTGRTDLAQKAEEVFAAFGTAMANQPMGHAHLIAAYLYSRVPSVDVTIACKQILDAYEMLTAARARYRPFLRVALKTPLNRLEQVAPYTESSMMQGEEATAYVCKEHACLPPVVDAQAFSELLQGLS